MKTGNSDAFFREKCLTKNMKDTEIDAADSLIEQCVGEYIAQFPANASWIRGHSKVSINGEQVLLRRCSRMCNYGGRITILMSEQPE